MYMCSKFCRLKLVSLTRLTAPFFPDKIQFNQPSILIWGSFLTSWKMNSSLVHKVIQLAEKTFVWFLPWDFQKTVIFYIWGLRENKPTELILGSERNTPFIMEYIIRLDFFHRCGLSVNILKEAIHKPDHSWGRQIIILLNKPY